MEILAEEIVLELPDLSEEEFDIELHIYRLSEKELERLEDRGHIRDIKDYIG